MEAKIKRLIHTTVALIATMSFLIALPGISLADGGKYVGTLRVAPEVASQNGETGFVLAVTDDARQPMANIPVSLTAQQMPQKGGMNMAGMNMSGAKTTVQAKPGAKTGEYTAAFKLNTDGDWMITGVYGSISTDYTVNVKGSNVQVTAGNPAVSASTSSPAGGAPVGSGPASMEAVHASYLDLSANITDLRSRVDLWAKGDESSQKIAQEKRDRSQVIIGSIGWPVEMTAAIDKTKQALVPMAKALSAMDAKAAQAASADLSTGSHDVTHAFYGDWLPTMQGVRFSPMAPHVIYLDISANINDLQSRVALWQNGDESSINIAKEKVDRLGILLPHLYGTETLVKPAQAIEMSLPAALAALEAKDLKATQAAIKPIADASQDLTRGFNGWMDVMAGAKDATCIQADYLDLSANITAFRTSVESWQKGDAASLQIAQARLARTQSILNHSVWPVEMEAAISKTKAAIEPMAMAISSKDANAAFAGSTALGDGSHDITHAYYADWLPFSQVWDAGAQMAGMPGMAGASGHGHDVNLPNFWFVGSMVGIVLITIVMVPILRKRDKRTLAGVTGA